jgi:hypothetical protein
MVKEVSMGCTKKKRSNSHPLPDYPVDLPNLYKRSIVFFRSLHSLVRVLPSHNLYQRLSLHDGEISLGYRLSTIKSNRKDEISLGILYKPFMILFY